MKYNRFTGLRNLQMTALVLLSLLSVVTGNAWSQTAIGILTPLSGNSAVLGKQFELGARLAIDEIGQNAPQSPIRLITRDSFCDEEKARQAAGQLLQLEVKIVIGPLCSKALYAALEVLSPANIPVIAPYIRASHLDQGRKKDGWRVYTLAPHPQAEAQNVVKFLLKRWQGKAYAIVDDGGIYGRGLADEFRELAAQSGQKPVAQANYRPLQSTQIAMVRRLAKSGIVAMFIGGEADDVAQIARDVEKLGLNIEIAGGESLALLPYVDDAASVPEGILAIMPLEPVELPSASTLVTRLRSQAIEPQGAIIPGYALAQIAAAALERNITRLENQTFKTIMGPVKFDDNGRASAYSYRLHVWRDQRIAPMSGF